MRGRTGTRGIQQLPLNVFNAAVEARKRSVGRSHRSASSRSGDGTVWVGRVARCSRFVFLMVFSLSLYVPGGIAIAVPVNTLHRYRRLLRAPTAREQRQRRRRHLDGDVCWSVIEGAWNGQEGGGTEEDPPPVFGR